MTRTSEGEAAPAPLNQRIRGDLEARILSGDWPPGHRIPYEHELMAQYACSRMTVSKAITALVGAGLIERRRKAGSFVSQPRIQSAVLQIPDLPMEVAARGEAYGYELLSRRRRSADAQDGATGMPAGEEVIELCARHIANGRPLACEERLISLKAVPEAAEVDFGTVPPGSWLLHHVPWTEAEHRITAINLDGALAGKLDLPKGTACLCVERRTWRQGLTVTFVRQIFHGEAYDLVARFGPQG